MFVDDGTRHVWAYVLKHKSEVFRQFKEWKAFGEKSTYIFGCSAYVHLSKIEKHKL